MPQQSLYSVNCLCNDTVDLHLGWGGGVLCVISMGVTQGGCQTCSDNATQVTVISTNLLSVVAPSVNAANLAFQISGG